MICVYLSDHQDKLHGQEQIISSKPPATKASLNMRQSAACLLNQNTREILTISLSSKSPILRIPHPLTTNQDSHISIPLLLSSEMAFPYLELTKLWTVTHRIIWNQMCPPPPRAKTLFEIQRYRKISKLWKNWCYWNSCGCFYNINMFTLIFYM